MGSKEIKNTARYRLVKRYIELGKTDELRKRLKENHIIAKEDLDIVAEEWLEELNKLYGKQEERPPWDHTEEEKSALLKKMEHPDVYVRCPRCGKEILWEHIGNSIRIGCATPNCIYTGIRGL